MKAIIAVLTLGNTSRYEFCLKAIREYAGRYGLPIHYITERRVNFFNFNFEKYQCLDLLGEYDRVLYMDADVMPTPTAGDIFADYPNEDYLYAYHENDFTEHMDRDPWIAAFAPDFEWPLYNGKQQYFNAGIALYSKRHANLMQLMRQMSFSYTTFSIDPSDQTTINAAVAKYKVPFQSLPHSYNRMDLGKPDPNNERLKAHFIHYAGPCQYGNGNKEDTMRVDYQALYL
jgi:lipopolysaccharide biosynthesis glycosyltransferase